MAKGQLMTSGKQVGPLGPNQFHQGSGQTLGHKVTKGSSGNGPLRPIAVNGKSVGNSKTVNTTRPAGFVRVPLGTK